MDIHSVSNAVESAYVAVQGSSISVASGKSVPLIVQTICQDVENDKGHPEWTDRDLPSNTLLVLQKIPSQLGSNWKALFGKDGASKVIPTLVQKPSHGRVALLQPGNLWQYYPESGYVGKDKAVFQVDTLKGPYQVVINIWVSEYVDENAIGPECKRHFRTETLWMPGIDVQNKFSIWNDRLWVPTPR